MRKIRKTTAFILAMAMAASMAGCGQNKKDEDRTTTAGSPTEIISVQGDTDHNYDAAVNDMYMEAETGCYDTEAACEYYGENIAEPGYEEFNTNEFNDYDENSWCTVAVSPLSTFAADVDTASYSNIRSYINNGYEIDPGMVRIEEMVNYFHYDYKRPEGDDRFAVDMEYADCPWNEDTKLARISMATEAIDFSDAAPSNIVFLIDTSGSMFDENKLPLVQQSLIMLAENFTKKDRVSIVTYAGADTVLLNGVSGDRYYDICEAIESLEAAGSTNGSAGINTAYEIAEKNFIKGGNNRVILATDGDLNVGTTSESALKELIVDKKKSGVFLSVIGVGNGNYKDNKLETLADNGNGTYAYIDSLYEARKALVENLGASMTTVAKDVKLQVEFNPALVKGYRLIGYENRVMAAEDFNDDTKDGGEMGAGHVVTALYEIALIDSDMEFNTNDLKYAQNASEINTDASYNADELFTLNIRYKEPDGDKSSLESYVCKKDSYSKSGSENLRWAAAVAEFGLMLKDSEYKGTSSYQNIMDLTDSVDYRDDDYKVEFVELVTTALCEERNY